MLYHHILAARIVHDCSLVILSEDLTGPVGMGLVVPKNSPLKGAFDQV